MIRGGSRAGATSKMEPAATFKMERFVIIVNGWKPLAIIIKSTILDVAAALDPPPVMERKCVSKTSQKFAFSSD